MKCNRLSLLSLLLLGCLPAHAFSATYALVVGIDAYAHENNLVGAVADALDISGALERSGADEITVLLDGDATRDAIESAYFAIVDRAVRGDTVIFTYSGHGAQSPELVAGEEEDGQDEFFLLPGFDRNRPEATGNERILDNEMRAWLKKADDKGVRTILVADSCFSGGMSRGFALGTRLAPAVTIPIAAPSSAALEGAGVALDDLELSTFMSGSLESQVVYEVVIDEKPRGALSYAFARAIEGGADLDKDGQISRSEMQTYVSATVRSRAEALQAPEFLPPLGDASRAILFESIKRQNSEAQPAVPSIGNEIALHITGGAPELSGVHFAATGAFSWDASSGRFTTPNGDVAGENVSAEGLQTVVDKFRLIELFKQHAVRGTVDVSLAPYAQTYFGGDIVSLSAAGGQTGRLIIFNLPNDGIAQFLGAFDGADSKALDLARFRVGAPFGADHVVALSIDGGNGRFVESLLSRSPAPTSTQLLDELPPLLETAYVGIQPIYTQEQTQ